MDSTFTPHDWRIIRSEVGRAIRLGVRGYLFNREELLAEATQWMLNAKQQAYHATRLHVRQRLLDFMRGQWTDSQYPEVRSGDYEGEEAEDYEPSATFYVAGSIKPRPDRRMVYRVPSYRPVPARPGARIGVAISDLFHVPRICNSKFTVSGRQVRYFWKAGRRAFRLVAGPGDKEGLVEYAEAGVDLPDTPAGNVSAEIGIEINGRWIQLDPDQRNSFELLIPDDPAILTFRYYVRERTTYADLARGIGIDSNGEIATEESVRKRIQRFLSKHREKLSARGISVCQSTGKIKVRQYTPSASPADSDRRWDAMTARHECARGLLVQSGGRLIKSGGVSVEQFLNYTFGLRCQTRLHDYVEPADLDGTRRALRLEQPPRPADPNPAVLWKLGGYAYVSQMPVLATNEYLTRTFTPDEIHPPALFRRNADQCVLAGERGPLYYARAMDLRYRDSSITVRPLPKPRKSAQLSTAPDERRENRAALARILSLKVFHVIRHGVVTFGSATWKHESISQIERGKLTASQLLALRLNGLDSETQSCSVENNSCPVQASLAVNTN